MRRLSEVGVSVLGIGVLALAGACGADDAGVLAASLKTEADLGLQPPLLRATLRSELAPLAESRRFERVFTTCGCLGATLFADGRRVAVGSTVGGGQRLTVVVDLEGRGHAGRAEESVRVFFSAGGPGRAPVQRELGIRCIFDRSKSVVGGRSPLVFVPLPAGEATETLRLDAALASRDLRVEGPAWLQAESVEDGTGAGPGAVRVHAGPVDIAGRYEATLLLPIAEGFFERVPVSIRVVSPEVLRPERVSIRLPVGATQELPLLCAGPRVEIDSGAIDSGFEAKQTAGAEARPALELRQALRSAGGSVGQRLVLRVRAGTAPGIYKGRALIRPRPGCSYRLALPWLVRVTPGVAAALRGTGEGGR